MNNDYFDCAHDNRLARCVELEISEGQGTNHKSLTLVAELRCGVGRISTKTHTASIAIDELELSITIQGGKIASGTRYGEHIKSPHDEVSISTSSSEISQTNLHSNFSAAAGASLASPLRASGSISANMNTNRRNLVSREASHRTTEVKHRVQAVGANTWVIREPTGELLNGTYLRDEALCRVDSLDGIQTVRGTASAPKKSIRITSVTNNETGGEMRLTTNKKKIVQILISQSIGTDGDRILLSESVLEARNAIS